MPKNQPASTSPWGPLQQPLFRAVWIATIASATGTWMHEVGASWLMTSLAPSPAMVALVQTATNLPIFLLALAAGALADIVDRRRLLLATQAWMLLCAATLAGLTLAGITSPWILLAVTFALGVGTALNAPAWQAIVPELVGPAQLPNAVSLNAAGINLARAVGPAVAGVIITLAGPGVTFAFNAVSFLGVLLVLYRWRRPPSESILPGERMAGAMRTGLRYVRYSPALRAVLYRTGTFTFCASALWALLPVIARHELKDGPMGYGILVGCLGIGAVAGAGLQHRLRSRMEPERLVAASGLCFAAALLALGFLHVLPLLAPVMLLGGAAWLVTLSGLNVAAQSSVASWVRARALSVYLLVFSGGMTAGSIVWGTLSAAAGTPVALAAAAGCLLVGLLVTLRLPLASGAGADLTPSRHWPAPQVAVEPRPEHGPVLVTVEYQIEPERAREFADAMRAVHQARRRDGAVYWGLFEDAAAPGRYVETFVSESWLEHLRQHERVTEADRAIEARALSLHVGEEPPVVRHILYAYEAPRGSQPPALTPTMLSPEEAILAQPQDPFGDRNRRGPRRPKRSRRTA